METIRTYTNTVCELEMAKKRLQLLLDRKEQLYCKYFPVTQTIKEDVIKGGSTDRDKMAEYYHELHEVDIGTGKSLVGEIEYLTETIDSINRCISDMNITLSKMSGIEHDLYYEIAVKGVNVSKAVNNIAEQYGKDVRTIWRHHYSKIKKYIRSLKKYSESTVNNTV